METTVTIHQHQYTVRVDEQELDDALDSTRTKYDGKLDTDRTREQMLESVQSIVNDCVTVDPEYDVNDV